MTQQAQLGVSSALFRVITGDDWVRAIRRSRLRRSVDRIGPQIRGLMR